MAWKVRNRETAYLCPYCKGEDFIIMQDAKYEAMTLIGQLHCQSCDWFKPNHDMSQPWGPPSPKLAICHLGAGEPVYMAVSKELIPPPPEETLAYQKELDKNCYPTLEPVQTQWTTMLLKEDVKKEIEAKKSASINGERWEEL